MDLLDCLLIITRNRWLIFKNVLIISMLSLVISLIIPKTYKPTATLFPVGSDGGGISSLLSGYSLNVFERSVVIPEAYRVILRSQGLYDTLIEKFDLFEVYDVKYKEQIYLELEENIQLEVDRELGIGYSPIAAIIVSVVDEDPQRATDMTNFCVSYLYDKVKDLNSFYIDKKFKFVEDHYLKNLAEMNAAETKMQSFQEKYGLIEIDEQIKLMIQSLAALESEKEKLEIELGVIGKSLGPSNPVYKNLQTNLDVLKSRIEGLKSGAEYTDTGSIIFYPTGTLPELAMEYFALYRDLEVNKTIYEMLAVQYEQTKIQVGKDIPSVLILDYAKVPTYKYKPKRILIVLSGFIVSLLISVAYVFFMDFFHKQKDEDSSVFSKMDEIRSMIRSDFNKLKSRKSK